MKLKPMEILIIEDDKVACNKFRECAKSKNGIRIVATTDSDVEGLKYAKEKRPEGIILDLELNNSKTGNANSLGLVSKLRKISSNYDPIIIVTTHVNSKRTYDTLHRDGVDLIIYKEQANYSCEYVLNTFLSFRDSEPQENIIKESKEEIEQNISNCISRELDLIGITSKLKGRKYVHDAILFLINNENTQKNVIREIAKRYQRSESTVVNGIQNAISHAWGKSAVEDLMEHYTAAVNYQTGEPTPMELIYYYVDKVKEQI